MVHYWFIYYVHRFKWTQLIFGLLCLALQWYTIDFWFTMFIALQGTPFLSTQTNVCNFFISIIPEKTPMHTHNAPIVVNNEVNQSIIIWRKNKEDKPAQSLLNTAILQMCD